MEKKNRNGRNVMAAFLTVSLAAGILGGCGQTAADTAACRHGVHLACICAPILGIKPPLTIPGACNQPKDTHVPA